ncbi:MAG: hypothetical protein IJ833_07845 [Lachnospiraceae bacterium]|nr:hypothetical protein [Lachnospiraceae bacterium]
MKKQAIQNNNTYKCWLMVSVLLGMLCLSACADITVGRGNRTDSQSLQPVTVEEVSVRVPGMEGEKRFLYLSDLHLIVESDQVAESEAETVHGRVGWSSYDGISAADSWKQWVDYLNKEDTEGVLLGADMVDFASEANVSCLKAGLDELEHPFMYVRADHDTAPFYLDGVTNEDSKGYQDTITPNDEVMLWEYEEFLIVGWNNSTENLSPAALERMKEIFAMDKPIILLTHVPIKSLVDGSLATQSKEAWQERELTWGSGCYHYPDAVTWEFLEMIYAEDSPVVEILCGHLHFTWDGWVTQTVHEHVFSPAFERCMGIITVSGE